MNPKNLKYFQSIQLPEDESTHPTFTAIEDVLQQEHDVSGKHPQASESQSGFATPDHIQKINAMYKWFQNNVINSQ